MIRKSNASARRDNSLDFVLSDATPDRLGDIIEPAGWDLTNFRSNPIALFNHRSGEPIGTWDNVRVDGGQLVGSLKFAKEGTSPRIDELRALTEQGILRATSVGFKPIEYETFEKDGKHGVHFKRQELLETSLVSIPANPKAVQIAKSILSPAAFELVFGKHADEDQSERLALIGKHAMSLPPIKVPIIMNPLQKQIEDAQARLVALKDQQAQLLAGIDVDNPSVEQLKQSDTIQAQIDTVSKLLAALRRQEETSAQASLPVVIQREPEAPTVPVRQEILPPVSQQFRPIVHATPAGKKLTPQDMVLRCLVSMVLSKATDTPATQIMAQRYGSDGRIDRDTMVSLQAIQRGEGVGFEDSVRDAFANFGMVTRANTLPADTATPAWAGYLAQTTYAAFMSLLMPASVYPGLSARGLSLSLGRAGLISIPYRLATPSIAGSFVGEGNPIPVRSAALNQQTIGLKKMAVISVFTREIATHSTPAIEGLIREMIQEDTAAVLDGILLDATAASAIRPAGLRNGIAKITATAGGGFAALVADMKALVAALITASNGNLRSPTWIMNPIQALSISLTQNAGGDFPFAQEINQNRFNGYPVIVSSTVTAGMVILVDAADFVSVNGDAPTFSVSDSATVHMEDTTPLPIGTPGAPPTVAAPTRSMWQTDCIALRMIMPVNWTMRRASMLAWTDTVTW